MNYNFVTSKSGLTLKMKILSLVITLMFFYSSSSNAASEGDVYGGLQYALFNIDDGSDEVEPTALVARIGRFLNENVAIEGRIGFGLEDDTLDAGPFDIDVDVDSLLGIYGVFHANSN